MKLNEYFLYVLISINLTESAKILGVFPMAGKSLNILCQRLMKGLADSGHDVTVITTQRNKLPIINGSYTEIELTGFWEAEQKLMSDWNILQYKEHNSFFQLELEFLMISVWNATLLHPNVKQLLNSNVKFDAVILESMLFNDCLKIFAQIYNCPLIAFSSMGGIIPWINNEIGNPLLPSRIPHYYLTGDYSKGMTFIDRAYNTLFYLRDFIIREFILFPTYNKLLTNAFINPPDIKTFYNNISLVLLGSHLSLRPTLPSLPNIVYIGGFHIDPPKKLPKDIQIILDEAKNGVIYFSMGTYVKSKDFPAEKRQIFLNVFRKLKQTILWKFEDEVLIGKPNNVHIRKWLPQMDILSHPNVKLFISHGGHGSLLETVYHGVPVLTIPVIVDQFNNANFAVALGFALKLSFNDPQFSETTLMNKINELLDNPIFKKNAKLRSELFHDRPMKPLDTAIYWIEYVIRHKGANHLRVAGYNMPWYQYYLVDVILCFLIIVLVGICCLTVLIKSLLKKQNVKKVKEQ